MCGGGGGGEGGRSRREGEDVGRKGKQEGGRRWRWVKRQSTSVALCT